jgi:hypothetical protein
MIIKSCIEVDTGAPAAYIHFVSTEEHGINDIIDRIKTWLREEHIDEPAVGFGRRTFKEASNWHWWLVFNDYGRGVNLEQGQYLIKDKDNKFWSLTEEQFKEKYRVDY